MKKLWICIASLFWVLLAITHCREPQVKDTRSDLYKTPEQIHEEIRRLNGVDYINHPFDESPIFFGIDERNHLKLVIIQECNDNCNERIYFLIYDEISEQRCKMMHGSPLYRLTTDIYLGCEPPYYLVNEPQETEE